VKAGIEIAAQAGPEDSNPHHPARTVQLMHSSGPRSVRLPAPAREFSLGMAWPMERSDFTPRVNCANSRQVCSLSLVGYCRWVANVLCSNMTPRCSGMASPPISVRASADFVTCDHSQTIEVDEVNHLPGSCWLSSLDS